MSGKYADRQEDELLFLREVFRNDLEDLRDKDPWKMNRAPEIQLRIVPDKSRGSDVYQKLYVLLGAKYPTNYPDDIPSLSIVDYKGISESSQKRLLSELVQLAEDSLGEVMMFQLVQFVQQFLDHNDQTSLPSLHEQMVQREQRKEDERKRRRERELETKQEMIEKEIEEAFKLHAEQRRKGAGLLKQVDADGGIAGRVSSSPALVRPGRGGSPLLMRAGQGGSPRGGPKLHHNLTPRKKEDVSVMGLTAAKLHRGKLLGTSSYGHSVYVGLMASSGELVALYEWVLHCRPAKRSHTDLGMAAARRVKQIQSIRQELYGLQHLGHRNIARYLDLAYDVDQDNITIQLCVEYIAGANLNKLLLETEEPFQVDKVRNVTHQLLEALTHLHSQGIVHKDLRLSLVFIDASEVVKVTGYAILKRLTDLQKAVQQQRVHNGVEDGVGGAAAEQVGGKRGDIVKLGLLVLSLATGEPLTVQPTRLPSDLPDLLRDFVNKCLDAEKYRTLSARDLLSHSFIETPLKQGISSKGLGIFRRVSKSGVPLPVSPKYWQDGFSLIGSPVISQAHFPPQKSRLKSEFEELEYIGRGGFGDVLKVRNYLDGRIYAIKRVQLPLDSKGINRKIIREVKLLSQMNHENVVRYFNAWIESQPSDELSSNSILEEEEGGGVSSSGQDPSSDGGSAGNGAGDFASLESTGSDSDSSDDSFISFTASEVNDTTSDSVVMFERTSESTLSSQGEEEEGEAMFSMSPTNYAVDTKTILAQIDRAKDYSDRSDPVIWHRSHSTDSFEELPGRSYSSLSQISYLYIQMEYCENRTLRHLIDESHLHRDDDILWRLFREITEGLNHIHKQGMIHRDLKPGNIFLDKNGHVKIGDFGLATTHGFTRKASIIPPAEVSMLEHQGRQDVSGPVGTFFYTAPEILNPTMQRKITQKADMYSLGVIFFEMCHPPLSTDMERHVILTSLRQDQPELPKVFSEVKMQKKSDVICWLLDHNPHRRPTAEDLLQSEYIPPKMEDKELLEVLTRTLSSTNSTSYQRLMAELFRQSVPVAQGFAYFYDLQTQKHLLLHTLVHQEIKDKVQSVFEKHNAVLLTTPLLMPKLPYHTEGDQVATLLDNTGGLVSLPSDLRAPLAKYVAMHEISDLRRFTINRVFRESGALRVNFAHPRETVECAFDIITDNTCSLLPDAECISVVGEIINEFPPLKSLSYSVHINHVLLLKAVLEHCSVPAETQKKLLHNHLQLRDGIPSTEDLLSSELMISKLAATQLARFAGSALTMNDARGIFEPLLKDTSATGTMANQGWHEVETVVSHLRSFGCKEQVFLDVGMVRNVYIYCGVFFQVRRSLGVLASGKKKHRKLILAAGGRYDRLISSFQVPSRQQSGRPIRGVGVSVSEDHIFSTIVRAQGSPAPVELVSRGAVLVHWLGVEQLTEECVKLASSLWHKGIPAQLYYTMVDTLTELQSYCHRNFIPHLVVLGDWQCKERNQLRVYSMEGGRVVADKIIPTRDVADYLLQKLKGYSRNMDSPDAAVLPNKPQQSFSASDLSAPQFSFIVVSLQKLPGHVKRKMQDQAYAKVVHIVKRLKCPTVVLSVDMDADSLSQLVLHISRQAELKDELSDIVKQVCEKCPKVNKKLLSKLCEEIHALLTESKCPVVILHSLTVDQVQVIPNIW